MVWKMKMCLRSIDNVNGVILDLTGFSIFLVSILFCHFSVNAQELYVLKDRGRRADS